MARPIAPEDLTWLLMDRPNNLMHVHGFMGFDVLPDLEAYTNVVMERMVRKFRRLSQVPVQIDGDWYWEDDVDFSIDNHVRTVVLDDADDETFRRYVSGQFSQPFDRTRPLWEFQLITAPGTEGGYGFGRFHHGLADGIRLVQMIISLCDPAEGAVPNKVGRNRDRQHQHLLEQALHFAETSVTDTIDFAGRAGRALARAGRSAVTTTNPLGLAHHIGEALELVRHPVKLIDAVTGLASFDNEVTNTWRELARMLISDGHEAGAWAGSAGVDKSVAWLESFPLKDLRKASKAYRCTLNDILLAAVSLALTDYLAERGVTDVETLSWMMPVSLQPVDERLPSKLGNKFVVVMLPMPLGIRDPERLIRRVHEASTRLKHSAEPLVAFGFQRIIAEAPTGVARALTSFFADKTIGQLTNVPGPRIALNLAGVPVRSILGWVPTSGDQPLGICLFSYNDSLTVGVASDARMIPDPEHLAALIQTHLEALSSTTKASHG
ncbi:MAG: DUF1298 domain-containing protein [Intrasporangiaceae bacterium]|nr:DUF1298 domain-containing protein [Intrasporangiaceae bacterium]